MDMLEPNSDSIPRGGSSHKSDMFLSVPSPKIPLLGTYVDLRSDWSFKKILSDSDVLVDFLNTFLPSDKKVASAEL